MSSPAGAFELLERDDVQVVRITESKMPYQALEALEQALAESIQRGTRKMVVNLAPVRFLDSFGIGVIAATARLMGQAGGRLSLCGVGERVRLSLTITRLDKMLVLSGDEEQALRGLRGED